MKTYRIIIIVTGILLLIPCWFLKAQEIVAADDELLKIYDNSNRIYTKFQVDTVASFSHQRMLGEAIVEGDFIRYQVDINSKKLINFKKVWRDDLPAELKYTLSQNSAEAKIEGEILFSKLFFISSGSHVFLLDTLTLNPCWVIRSNYREKLIISIVDAVTGEFIGHGTPPPYEGVAIHGPDWGDCPQDPIPGWTVMALNAKDWFEQMGYNSTTVGNASAGTIQSYIESDETCLFYEFNHGGYTSFHNRCDQNISAADIHTWIDGYSKMPFTFLANCAGMCEEGVGTFTSEFLKDNSMYGTVVGYCHMDQEYCHACFLTAYSWQDELFNWLNNGYTVLTAFNQANLAYPECAAGSCMRFAGDMSLALVPKVRRSYCGNLYDGQLGPLLHSQRGHFIRCDVTVPIGQNLTIGSDAEVIFLNNSSIISAGNLNINGSAGQLRLFPETDYNSGIVVSGQVKSQNGGQIKIFE